MVIRIRWGGRTYVWRGWRRRRLRLPAAADNVIWLDIYRPRACR